MELGNLQMSSKIILIAVFFMIIMWAILKFGFVYLDNLSERSELDNIVTEIRSEFRGVIIKKYSTREVNPTHLEVRLISDSIIVITPGEKIMASSHLGDSIIKLKNENTINLKNKEGKLESFFYVKIPNSYRNKPKFPKEWNEKWPESSEFD